MFRNDINNYLNKASNTASDHVAALAFLEKALENTEAKISCMGGRYITSTTNGGWTSVGHVANTANKIFDKLRKTWDFDNKTRSRIKKLEAKIDSFYTRSDKIIGTRTFQGKINWFTKILNYIREFNLLPYTTRFFWEENTRLSSHYRADQWSILWGRKPNPTLCSRQPEVYYHA